MGYTETQRNDLAQWIGRFIFRLRALVESLTGRYSDATAFQFNTNSLFTQVLNNASVFSETAGYRILSGFCKAYEL